MFYDQYLKLCEQRGEKPTPVAQKLGCSSSNIAMWKKGSTPREKVLQKIADYFNVTTQYLLFGEETVSENKEAPSLPAEGVHEKLLIEFFRQLSPERQQEELAYLEQAAKRGAAQDM